MSDHSCQSLPSPAGCIVFRDGECMIGVDHENWEHYCGKALSSPHSEQRRAICTGNQTCAEQIALHETAKGDECSLTMNLAGFKLPPGKSVWAFQDEVKWLTLNVDGCHSTNWGPKLKKKEKASKGQDPSLSASWWWVHNVTSCFRLLSSCQTATSNCEPK